MILAHTKLDIENPTLREWCLLFIRNITSWSDPIRIKLKELSMMEGIGEVSSKKVLDSLGDPLRDMYMKEREKYKKDEED